MKSADLKIDRAVSNQLILICDLIHDTWFVNQIEFSFTRLLDWYVDITSV